MDIREIYKLMETFEASEISEFNLEMEGVKLGLKKNTTETPHVFVAEKPERKQSEAKEEPEADHKEESEDILVKAPLVGTFYRAASPEEKPFVIIGQQVKKGDVVGIIEAMKLMNEITAPEDGVVTAIEAGDGKMVEYDEVLLRMESL